MSKALLYQLNGSRRGLLRDWLDAFSGEPRIAWYPASGFDFRDLLHLHPSFTDTHPGSQPDVPPPDIFLHTDYFPWQAENFLGGEFAYHDRYTQIRINYREELPCCRLPRDSGIVHFPQRNEYTDRVIFLELEVTSHLLGCFSFPLIYAFVENVAFAGEYILPLKAQFSHIMHVRYAGGYGGGASTGIWLFNILRKLSCECFLTDQKYGKWPGDERAIELYPELGVPDYYLQLKTIRTLPRSAWDAYDYVAYRQVKTAGQEEPQEVRF